MTATFHHVTKPVSYTRRHGLVVTQAARGYSAAWLQWGAPPSIEAPRRPDDRPAALPMLPSATVYQKILVPTDGTEESEAAVLQAVITAIQVNAKVVDILFILEPPDSYRGVAGVQSIMVEDVFQALHRSAEAYTKAQVQKMQQFGGASIGDLKIGTRILEQRDVSAGILQVAAAGHYDLIILATHGRRGISRMLFGSTTEDLIRKTDVPVMAVHTTASLAAAKVTSCPRFVLVPVDGSEYSTRAVKEAIAFVRSCVDHKDAVISLLNVMEPMGSWMSAGDGSAEYAATLSKDLVALANLTLNDASKLVTQAGIKVATEIDEGYVVDTIVRHAAKSDLVVMGTRGRTGFSRMMFGSVTESVLRTGVSVPVLCVHLAL